MPTVLKESTLERAERLATRDGFPDVDSYLDSVFDRAELEYEERDDTIRAIREGLDDIAAGRYRPAEEVFREIAIRHGLS